MTPPDAAQGCLQDIHWSMGGMGYFPTYTLGNLNAAQLFRAARQNDGIAKDIDHANYGSLLQWLRTNVHFHGSVLSPRELMKTATGEPTDARWHLEHLKARFLA
jgi:carboxypeptidase Taq